MKKFLDTVTYSGNNFEAQENFSVTTKVLPPEGCITFNRDWLKPGALVEVNMHNIMAYHKEVVYLDKLAQEQAQTIKNLQNALSTWCSQEEKSSGTRAYQAWRRSEAYSVPVTDAGAEKAEERRKQFNKGFYAGMKHAALILELEHKKVKDSGNLHNYYGVASNLIRNAYKEDLSEECLQKTDKN